MIPIRVRLEGFLSYHDEAVLDFEAAPLWMLTGPNGAGKSAVFDAITFALYGLHRGGKQNAKALINQRSDRMLVEFDFRLEADVYRIKRTVARHGQATRQVLHLHGPNSLRPGRAGPVAVPETESERGLQAWVAQSIGLSENAFLASVMLRQGEGDQILRMDARERHGLLSQLVDLSLYTALCERAEAQHKTLQAQAESFQLELNRIAPVESKDIEAVECELEQADDELTAAQARLAELAGLKAQAGHWRELSLTRDRLVAAIAHAESLLQQAGQIEAEAARLAELNHGLPRLELIVEDRDLIARCEAAIGEAQQQLRDLEGRLASACAERETAQQTLATLQSQIEHSEGELQRARQVAQQLDPDMRALQQLDELRAEVSQLTRDLSRFPSNLPEQIARLEAEVAELEELLIALPSLTQLHLAWREWRSAQSAAGAARALAAELHAPIAQAEGAWREAEAKLKETEARLVEIAEQVTREQVAVENIEKRLENLRRVEDTAECEYCGQPLTPEHLQAENERLQQTLHRAQTQSSTARRQKKSATAQRTAQAHQRDTATQQLSDLKEKQRAAQQEAAGQEQRAAQVRAQFEQAVTQLSPDYQARITALEAVEPSFPSADDLSALKTQAAHHAEKKRKLEAARRQEAERNKLLGNFEARRRRLNALEAQYPPERVTELQAQFAAIAKQVEAAQAGLDVLKRDQRTTSAALQQAQTAEGELRLQHGRMTTRVESEQARRQERQASLARQKDQLDEPWRSRADAINAAELEMLKAEARSLAGAEARRDELNRERQGLQPRRDQLAETVSQIERIPLEARQDVADVERLEAQAGVQLRQAQTAQVQAQLRRQELLARREQRHKADSDRQAAAHQAELYGQLARWLGPHYLQKHLLEQVEAAIVENADAVLDRVSGGALRLELLADTGTAKTKALDLVAYSSRLGPEPVPVNFLSGSQRFRVAVSLALGIGQYATRAARQVEAVIIDEGFGSLDKNGRHEMIDELLNLQGTLSRIILVSHQEEFATAFPNCYRIELADKTSRVSLMAPQG